MKLSFALVAMLCVLVPGFVNCRKVSSSQEKVSSSQEDEGVVVATESERKTSFANSDISKDESSQEDLFRSKVGPEDWGDFLKLADSESTDGEVERLLKSLVSKMCQEDIVKLGQSLPRQAPDLAVLYMNLAEGRTMSEARATLVLSLLHKLLTKK